MPEAGPLLAIGGHEDLRGERRILRRVADLLAGSRLALVTAASRHPAAYVERYRDAFHPLGVEVIPLTDDDPAGVLERSGGVFLTGGKQLRLVGYLRRAGLVPVLRERHRTGALVAGTSAGASALAEAMIARGPGPRAAVGTRIELGAGIGLVGGVIIDQHFAERGRGVRLREAVAADPSCVGIGIDEDTAVELHGERLTVRGSGAVTVIDARRGSVRSARNGQPATLRDAVLHVLADGDTFSLRAP